MTDIDALAKQLVAAMTPVLERFVADTQAAAEREMNGKVSDYVGKFLAGLNTDHIPPKESSDQADRLMPGTVKPALRRFMREQGHAGFSIRELVAATGFKFNSVRGTMWQLARDGEVELREGKYYPKSAAGTPETDKPAP